MLTTFDSLSERIQMLEEELKHVLSDWNDLVKAIGAPKNGIAIGHVKALVAERDKYKARAKAMERGMKEISAPCRACVYFGEGNCRAEFDRCCKDKNSQFIFDESRFAAHETAENEQQTDLMNKNE